MFTNLFLHNLKANLKRIFTLTNETIHHIHNRHDMRMVVYVTEPEGDKRPIGTVVMSHGLSSSSSRPIFTQTTATFLEAGYRVVRYDATHSLGGSDGDPQYCTMTSLLEDYNDVLQWAEENDMFRQQKKVLMGHSLGAMAAGLCVEGGADALILVSSVTDGELSFTHAWTPEELARWKQRGYVERSVGRDNYHRIRYSHYIDRCVYSLLASDVLAQLHIPVLLISGTQDGDRPGTDDLEQAISNTHGHAARLTRLDIDGAGHSIREPEHVAQVNVWIKSFLSQM